MDDSEKTLAESALTFATFAAFALPEPGGFVVAGALATLNVIMSACAGGDGQNDQFMATLSASLQKDLEHDDINIAVSTFSAYAVWLKEYRPDLAIPPKLQPIGDALAYAEFKNFYDNLQKAVTDPGQPLRDKLQLLMRDDAVDKGDSFSTRALCALLYGAGVFAALSKIYISINSTAFQATDNIALQAFCAELDRIIKHASSVFSYVESQRGMRISTITDAHQTTADLWGSGWNPTVQVVEIQDKEGTYPKPDKKSFDLPGTFFGGSYSTASIPNDTIYVRQNNGPDNQPDYSDRVFADANAFRGDYVQQAQLLFDGYFFGANRPAMEQTLAGLTRALENASAQLPAA